MNHFNKINNYPGIENDMNMVDKIMLIAEMYYSYGLSQGEVAEKLAISRPWVSKLLNRAIEMGIVRIEVISPRAGFSDMEKAVKEKYSIRETIIVKDASTNENYNNLGKVAANYFMTRVKPGDIIGVSWGLTISTMIEYLIPMKIQNVTVVPLVGGLGSKAVDLSNVAAMKIAEAFNAKCNLLHAQAFCSSKEEKEAVLSNPQTQAVIEQGKHTDIALLSVGDLHRSTISSQNHISEERIKDLENCNAVGDIALRFIDKNGKIIDHEINSMTIACPLEDVARNAREVICLACGEHKIKVIDAALKGKWFSSLITDVRTASALLNFKD